MGGAYLLIKVAPGKVKSVITAVRKIKNIKTADAITGPYDIIAYVEETDINALGKFVIDKIQKITGVVETITCIAVEV